MRMLRRMAAGLAAATVMAAPPAHAVSLEPYKMVRSLQLVQDQLARGDHAALPMQRKLLEMIDERFRTAQPDLFADMRNVTALLVYAMSGGNPTTIEVAMARLPEGAVDDNLGRGILAYMQGNLGEAGRRLATVDPMRVSPETGAFVALVKGSILARDAPQAALRLMDIARLLSPGTLVEEAALRRSLPILLELDDAERFVRAANQYTRRFLRSPYASQFADAFVDGLVVFHDEIDTEEILQIVSFMSPVQQEAIFLRLARRATIAGLADLASFASQKAVSLSRSAEMPEDPRASLYEVISSITSDNIHEVAARLDAVDARELTARDRRLLRAAKTLAGEVLARPAADAAGDAVATAGDGPVAEELPDAAVAPPLPEPRPAMAARDAAPAALASADPLAATEPPAGARPVRVVGPQAVPAPRPAAEAQPPALASAPVDMPSAGDVAAERFGPEGEDAVIDPTQLSEDDRSALKQQEALVTDARARLEAIDKLLEEAPK